MTNTPDVVFANAKKYRFLIIAALIVIALICAYEFGYRVGPGVTLARVGTLELTGLPKGASIYADLTLRSTTGKAGDQNEELVAGSHTIIVSEPNDYPWSAVVSIASGKNTAAAPIFVSLKPNVTPLAATSTDYKTASAAIASSTFPTISNPLKLANGCAVVYVSNNQVIADVASSTPGCVPPPFLCTNGSCAPTIIFSPVNPLSGVFAYPGRQDAIVVSFNKTLYALALDPRSPQFFAPILTGTDPVPGILSDGTIVVRNGTAIYRVNL